MARTRRFEGCRVNLRRHVLPRLGSRTLSSLRPDDVDELIAGLKAEGKAPGKVCNVVVPLRRLLEDAVRQGLLLANAAARGGCGTREPAITLKRYSHLLDARVTEAATRFDPAGIP
jgi:hypothetical protein